MCRTPLQAALLSLSLFHGHGTGSIEHLPPGATLDIHEHRSSDHQVFKAGCWTVYPAVSTGDITASAEWGIHSSGSIKCYPTYTAEICQGVYLLTSPCSALRRALPGPSSVLTTLGLGQLLLTTRQKSSLALSNLSFPLI